MRYNGFWWRVLKPFDRLFAKTDKVCTPILARWFGYALRKWRCEHCGTFRNVKQHPAMTMYHFEGAKGGFNDPNREKGYCTQCAKDYDEYWQEMWDEYNASRG